MTFEDIHGFVFALIAGVMMGIFVGIAIAGAWL